MQSYSSLLVYFLQPILSTFYLPLSSSLLCLTKGVVRCTSKFRTEMAYGGVTKKLKDFSRNIVKYSSANDVVHPDMAKHVYVFFKYTLTLVLLKS